MSRKRRLVALSVVISLCSALLSGCTNQLSGERNQVILADEEAAVQEKILRFFAPMDTPNNDGSYYRELIDQYNGENSGTRVVYEGISTADGFNKYLAQRLDTGQGDDIFIVNADMVKPLYHKGYFYDLSGLPAFQRMNESTREQAVIGDIAYCLPVSMTAYCLFVNLDVLDRYGLQPPKDLEEFRVCCRTLKEAGKTPISLNRGYALTVPAMAAGLYQVYSADNVEEIRQGLNSGDIHISDYMLEGFQSVEEFIREGWYGDGLDMATVNAMKAGDQDIRDFIDGKTAFYFGHLNAISMVEKMNSTLNYVVQGVPIPGGTVTLPAALTRLCVNANSEYLEETIDFINYITTEKYEEVSSSGNGLLPIYSDAEYALNSERMRPAYETFITGGQIPIEDMQLQFTYWDTIRELGIAMFDGFTAEEAAAAYDLRQAEQIALYQN